MDGIVISPDFAPGQELVPDLAGQDPVLEELLENVSDADLDSDSSEVFEFDYELLGQTLMEVQPDQTAVLDKLDVLHCDMQLILAVLILLFCRGIIRAFSFRSSRR